MRVLAKAVAGLVCILMGKAAWGCSCMGQPACGRIGGDDAMFVAKVLTVSVVDLPMENFVAKRRLYRMEVLESLRGSERVGDVVSVGTGMGGGDCGYGFQLGGRYLVDAWVAPSGLSTGICSATASEGDATVLLRELRTVAAGGRLPDLSGRVASGSYGGGPMRALAGLDAKVVGADRVEYRARTDAEGMFAFGTLPPGRYEVEVALPNGQTTYEWSEKKPIVVNIPDVRGVGAACRVEVRALPGGRISGVVDVGTARRLTAFVGANEVSAGADGTHAHGNSQVDERGGFTVRFLPAGEYVLEFATGQGYQERWFYPGVRSRTEASTVHVDEGKETGAVKIVVK